jgi:hypothetical protein
MEMKVTKIVYNACFGGFGLSGEAMKRYAELKGFTVDSEHGFYYLLDLNGKRFSDDNIRRDDPILVQVVEELGDRANTRFSDLRIRDLPSGTKYRIDEYDGNEAIETEYDIDWSVA